MKVIVTIATTKIHIIAYFYSATQVYTFSLSVVLIWFNAIYVHFYIQTSFDLAP